MGVKQLWTLLEPSSRPIKLETLNCRLLAIDVSGWLYQALSMKGKNDEEAQRNAPLLLIFHRLCKLRFLNLRPIFVFDGAPVALKKTTMAARRQRRERTEGNVRKAAEKLLVNALQLAASSTTTTAPAAAASGSGATSAAFISRLTDNPRSAGDVEEEEEEEEERTFLDEFDVRRVDIDSEDFQQLPEELQFEILRDVQEHQRRRAMREKSSAIDKAELSEFSQIQLANLMQKNALSRRLDHVASQMLATNLYVSGFESRRVASDKEKRIIFAELSKGGELPAAAAAAATTAMEGGAGTRSGEGESKIYGEAYGTEVQRALLASLDQGAAVSDDDESGAEEEASDADEQGEASERERQRQLLKNLMRPSQFESTIESEGGGGGGGGGERTKVMDLGEEEQLQLAMQMSLAEASRATRQAKESSGNSDNQVMEVGMEEKEEGKIQLEMSVGLKGAPERASAPSSLFTADMFGIDEEDEAEVEKVENGTDRAPSSLFTADMFGIDEEDEAEVKRQGKETTMDRKENDTEVDTQEKGTKVDTQENDTEVDTQEKGTKVDTQEKRTKVDMMDEEAKEDGEGRQEGALDTQEKGTKVDMKDEEKKADSERRQETALDTQEKETKGDTKEKGTKADREGKVILGALSSLFTADMFGIGEEETVEKEKEETVGKFAGTGAPLAVETLNLETKSSTTKLIQSVDAKDTVDNIQQPALHSTPIAATTLTASTTRSALSNIAPVLHNSTESVADAHARLQAERTKLLSDQALFSRANQSLPADTYDDVQQLLRLFGVPFLVAPGEAEAQCAELERLGLVEGTISDDSDTLLFGGRRVYRHFFTRNRDPHVYTEGDVLRTLGLTRDRLVSLAYLLGCDYCDGVQGVGPVLAMEILEDFDTLEAFQQFVEGLDAEDAEDLDERFARASESRLRKRLRVGKQRIGFPAGFPDPRVREAFMKPRVDSERAKFSFALPNLDGLRVFCEEKFGWDERRSDSLLKPMLARLAEEKKTRQTGMDGFMVKVGGTAGQVKSKRLRAVVGRLTGQKVEEKEEVEVDGKRKKKRKDKGNGLETKKRAKTSVTKKGAKRRRQMVSDGSAEDDGDYVVATAIKKRARTKRKVVEEDDDDEEDEEWAEDPMAIYHSSDDSDGL